MSCCEWQVPWSQEDSLWVCFFFFFLFYWEMPSYFFSKVFSRIKWLVIFSDVGWIVILTPSKKEGWSPNPSKSERDLTWKPLYRGNWVKMRSLKWALIQYDWWPYKRWKFGCRDRYAGREDDVEIQGVSCEGNQQRLRLPEARAEAWDRPSLTALRRNQPSSGLIKTITLILDF